MYKLQHFPIINSLQVMRTNPTYFTCQNIRFRMFSPLYLAFPHFFYLGWKFILIYGRDCLCSKFIVKCLVANYLFNFFNVNIYYDEFWKYNLFSFKFLCNPNHLI